MRGGPVAVNAGLQAQAPGLAEEFRAEFVVWFGLDDFEADGRVDPPCGGEDAVRPQHDLAVAGLPRKADAFLDKPAADPEPARLRLDDQHAQPGDRVAFLDDKHRADPHAILLGDPALVARRVEVAQEPGDDFGDIGFHLVIETVFLRIERAVAIDDPAHVAGAMRAQDKSRCRLAFPAEQLGDDPHRCHETRLLAIGERRQQRADRRLRGAVERFERVAALRGQRDHRLPAVLRRLAAQDQALPLEVAQDPRQIAGVEIEFAAEPRGGRAVALRHRLEYPALGQRKRRVEERLRQNAELLRVEPVETADRRDTAIERRGTHAEPPRTRNWEIQSTIWLSESSICGEHHLRLGDERDEPAVRGGDARRPNLRAASAMDRRRLADEPRAERRAGDEVGLAFERRRAGAGGQVEDRAGGAERVGKRHERAAMHDRRVCAQFRAHRQLGDDPLLVGGDEGDAEQFGKGQLQRAEAGERVHGTLIIVILACAAVTTRYPPNPGGRRRCQSVACW